MTVREWYRLQRRQLRTDDPELWAMTQDVGQVLTQPYPTKFPRSLWPDFTYVLLELDRKQAVRMLNDFTKYRFHRWAK